MNKLETYNLLIKECHDGIMDTVKDMNNDLVCAISPEEFAYDVASDILLDEPWIDSFLKNRGISDVHGRLVDDMCSGYQLN